MGENAPAQSVGRGLTGLRESARGWLTIQLAVLGFIGLCGVLKSIGSATTPRAVQVAASLLALLGLAAACAATFSTGRVAWPLYRADARTVEPAEPGDERERQRASRRLRAGLVLTIAAVVLVSAAATSTWWPVPAAASTAALLSVDTPAGTVCGTLSPNGNRALTLDVSGQRIEIPLSQVLAVRPVSSC